MNLKIGVFDSGVGGEAVTIAVQKAFPQATVVFKDDRKNLPYGNKSVVQLINFVTPIIKQFEVEGCDVVVIACNTVTTNIITELRSISKIPLVGIEPMVKPAASMTKTGTITVCATPMTLSSDRYKFLKSEYASGVDVLEPDCSDWAELIESNSLDRSRVRIIVNESRNSGSDIIVLGCTHYHWIEDIIREEAGDSIRVIQPTKPVIDQLKRVLGLLL